MTFRYAFLFTLALFFSIFLFASVAFAAAPSITINSPSNTTYSTSSVTLNVTTDISANVTYSLNGAANISLYDETTSGTASVGGLQAGSNNITVYAINATNASEISSGTIHFSTGPDFIVTAITWNSTSGGTPNKNDNVTVNATVKNDGSWDFSGDVNATLFWGTKGGTLSSKATETIANTSLTAGSSYSFQFNTTITPGSNAVYTIKVEMDDESAIAEGNESNNELTEDLAIGYNVTVLSVSPASPKPGQNITVNVSVLYADDSAVTDVTKENFTAYDKHSGSTLTTWTSSDTVLNSTFDDLQAASGIYWFNITTYNVTTGDTKPDAHNISVKVQKDANWSGTSDETEFYNLTVPYLQVEFTGLDTSMTEGTDDTFNIEVKNTGTDTIYNITVDVSKGSEVNIDTNTCVTVDSLTPGETNTSCGLFEISVDNVTATTTSWFAATATGNSSDGITYTSALENETITISAVTGNGNGDTTAGADECSTDADCSAAYYCSNGDCKALSCAADESAKDHECVKNYVLKISDYPEELEIVQGENATGEIKVENTGAKALEDVELALAGIDTAWYATSPASTDIAVDATATFDYNFTIPVNASIGNYSIEITATSEEDATDSVNFTIYVLPTNATKTEINVTFEELENNVTAAAEELEDLMRRLNTTNLTEANTTMTIINSLVDEAKAALEEGDYLEVAQKMSQIDLLLEDVRQTIESERAKVTELLPITTWGGIGIAAAGIAVLLLFVYFKPGYKPKRGFRPKKKRVARPSAVKIGQKIKEALKALAEKIRNLFKRRPRQTKLRRYVREKKEAKEARREAKEEGYERSWTS